MRLNSKPGVSPQDPRHSVKMTRTEGNVFAGLGFDTQTAENLRIRADLMIELREVIRRKAPSSSAYRNRASAIWCAARSPCSPSACW